jgi:hypothetical protein
LKLKPKNEDDPMTRSDRSPDDDQSTLENLPDDLAMAYADQAVEKGEPVVEQPVSAPKVEEAEPPKLGFFE